MVNNGSVNGMGVSAEMKQHADSRKTNRQQQLQQCQPCSISLILAGTNAIIPQTVSTPKMAGIITKLLGSDYGIFAVALPPSSNDHAYGRRYVLEGFPLHDRISNRERNS